MIKILFICHGSILKSPGKAGKINGFTERNGAYSPLLHHFSKNLDVTICFKCV